MIYKVVAGINRRPVGCSPGPRGMSR